MPTSTPGFRVSGQLPAASAALFTVPANTKEQIIACTLHNPTGTARTYTLWLVASGGSANDAAQIREGTIAINQSIVVSELIGQFVNAAGAVHGVSDAATAVTYHISTNVIT